PFASSFLVGSSALSSTLALALFCQIRNPLWRLQLSWRIVIVLRHVGVDQLVSLFVLRRHHTDSLADLVRGGNLIARELICNICNTALAANWNKLERVSEI